MARGQRAANPTIAKAWSSGKGSIPQAFGRGAQAGQFRAAEAKSGKFTLARGRLANELTRAHSNATSKGGDEQVSGKRVRAKAYLAGYKAQTGMGRGKQKRHPAGSPKGGQFA